MKLIVGLIALLGQPFGLVLKGLFFVTSEIGNLLTDTIYGHPVIVSSKTVVPAVKAKTAQAPNSVASTPMVQAVAIKAEAKPAVEKSLDESKPEKPKAQQSIVATPHPYGVAERVQTAELIGQGGLQLGVMWAYLYHEKRIVRRVFKVTNRALASALKRERWYMEDVDFDPLVGIGPIMDQMGRECAKLLNQPSQPTVREKTVVKPKPQSIKPVVAAAPVAPALVAQVEKPAPMLKPAPVAEVIAPTVVMPNHSRAVKGQIYAGTVTTAGMTTRSGASGPYQTFCLTIHDGTRETPLFGAELQRQAKDMQIRPGENVKVVFMGQEAFDMGGKQSYRNLYQVSRMGQRS